MPRLVALSIAIAAVVTAFNPSPCSAQMLTGTDEHWKWGTIAEVDDRQTIITAVETAVKAEDFPKLDQLEIDYRDSKTASGIPKLSIYYQELLHLLRVAPNPGSCIDSDGQQYIERWQAASRHSPAPVIAKAGLLQNLAWCYRGSGTADTVPTDGWQLFNENLRKARTVLEQAKPIASRDPEYYVELVGLYAATDHLQNKFGSLFSEATARYPYYYGLYEVAFNYATPRWGGSLSAMDAVARFAVTKTQKRDGASAYFRIYWHSVVCNCVSDLSAMDWPIMQAAMVDLARVYPGDWTYLHLIQMSCLRGEAAEATKYFAKLDINEAGSWEQEKWEACRTLIGRRVEALPTAASQ